MKQAVVIGALSNIGYSLCCGMLDEAYQVIALDDLPNENSQEEDNLLRVGRNAYFQFKELTKETLTNQKDENYEMVLYVSQKENLRKISEIDIIKFCYNNASRLILISKLHHKDDTNEKTKEIDSFQKIKPLIEKKENTLNQENKLNLYITVIDFPSVNIEEGLKMITVHNQNHQETRDLRKQ